jgi:hypothetical protein
MLFVMDHITIDKGGRNLSNDISFIVKICVSVIDSSMHVTVACTYGFIEISLRFFSLVVKNYISMDREFQTESHGIFLPGGTRSERNRLMKYLLGCLFYTFLD